MTITHLVVVTLLAGVCLGFPSNGLIVKFKDGTSKRSVHARYGGEHKTTLDIISADVVTFASPEHAEAALEKYLQDPEIQYAEPDHVGYASAVNDPQFSNVWSLGASHFNIERVWADHGVTGSGVIVAVLDTGVQSTHEDLVGQVLTAQGYDFVNNDNDASDDNGHGTHCAGTIAAARNNAMGISGVAPGAKILPVKVLAANGGGFYSQWIQGLQWAVSQGAKVINLSLGGNSFSQPLADAVLSASNSGVFLACAMGNDGEKGSPTHYPAAMPGCNGIANHQSDSNINPSSTRGNYCKVTAPGTSILSTVPKSVTGSDYLYYTGTSMATPHIAGVVALMLQKRSSLTPAQITQLLISTATDRGAAGFDNEYGYGIVNVYAALSAIAPVTTGVQTTGVQTTGSTVPPTTNNDVVIYSEAVYAPFRTYYTSYWVNFYSTTKKFAGSYSMFLSPTKANDYLLIACDSNCFNPVYYESITFRFSGGTVYFYATDAAYQALGPIKALSTLLGLWTTRTYSLLELGGGRVPTYLIFYANSGNTGYIDNLVMTARAVPLAGAVYEKPLGASEVSANPSQTGSLSPWQFSVTGNELFTVTTTYEYVPGDQTFTYEAEVTVGGVVHKIALETLNAGQLTGYTPQFAAAGAFSMKILRNGADLFPDAFPVQTYDCAGQSSCDVCVTVGPQCLWCQDSCTDIRGSTCPFDEQAKQCEPVLSESSAVGLVLSTLLIVLAAAMVYF